MFSTKLFYYVRVLETLHNTGINITGTFCELDVNTSSREFTQYHFEPTLTSGITSSSHHLGYANQIHEQFTHRNQNILSILKV